MESNTMGMQEKTTRSVLLVDDDPTISQLLSRWLSAEEYQCRAVLSARDALYALSEEPFDLLFLDINMPEMTGIEILKEVRHSYPDLGIIIVTGIPERDSALATISLGADGYLNKPVNRLELILSAANVIMRRQLARQAREKQEELSLLIAKKTKELQEAYDALRRSHEQILQQEKMAAIGQLAAGVAHEINNPTGFIASNLSTLDKYLNRLVEFIAQQDALLAAHVNPEILAQHQELRKNVKIDSILKDGVELIGESKEGTERIKKIVQGLKNFSRKDQDKCIAANINECLDNTLDIVWNELKYKATVSKDFGELPLTYCFPQQLSQVFMNLLVNASHAIAEKGTIVIRTWHDQDGIHVSVTDSGCGIPAENLARIFEPFFTTKELGKGTGLGMSISADIVKRHHGVIDVQSEVGKGTTFVVTFPVKEECSNEDVDS